MKSVQPPLVVIFLPYANKVVKRQCFYTCLSFCSQGSRRCIPPRQTPPRQTLPGQTSSLGRHSLGRHPQGDIPPGRHPSLGRHTLEHCNRWYASYWNEFIFMTYFYRARGPWPPPPGSANGITNLDRAILKDMGRNLVQYHSCVANFDLMIAVISNVFS